MKAMRMRFVRPILLLTLAASLACSGCDDGDRFVETLVARARTILSLLNDRIGHRLEAKPKLVATSSPASTPTRGHREVNAGFIHELFKVVLLREVRNEEEFLKYMHIIDEGAHYEGIYNGIVYSAEYKEREKGVSPVGAVKTYVTIMSQILLDQKYDPLKIHRPEERNPLEEIGAAAPPQPTELERESLKTELQSDALTKPFFVLKRRLGEEVIRTVELKREYKEKLATWYARFSVTLNKHGVDFGVPERNKLDEYGYYRWALDADEDRLRWECLNRVHVLMNVNK